MCAELKRPPHPLGFTTPEVREASPLTDSFVRTPAAQGCLTHLGSLPRRFVRRAHRQIHLCVHQRRGSKACIPSIVSPQFSFNRTIFKGSHMYKDWLASYCRSFNSVFITIFPSFKQRTFGFILTACGVADRKHQLLST